MDVGERNHSEFRINPKHAIGTTLLGPGLIFDLNRVVQTFHSKSRGRISLSGQFMISLDKSSRFGQDAWLLNSPHNLYYLQYTLPMNDFLILDSNEKKGRRFSSKN